MTEPDAPDRPTSVPTSRSGGEGGTEVVVRTDGGDHEPERIDLPEVLPVLPLKNTVLFPFLLSPLLVNSARSKRLIEHVLLTPERLMLAVAVNRELEGSPGPDDLHRTGSVLRVVKMLKFPDDSYRLLVQGVTRAQIEGFVEEKPFLRARVHRVEETGDVRSVEVTALSRSVAQQFGALVTESPKLADELQSLAANIDDPSKLADLVASNLDLSVAAKQEVLEERDVPTRLRRVLAEIARAREALKIESEIREKVQSEMGRTQREYMLRQQLDAIRRELGESEESDAELGRLRERIEAAGMPEEAQKQALRELDRLAQMPAAAAEHGVIRT
ncbi:MAG TPA: hypothetical protein DEP35_23045, partial [Deltaproteobacteria bacterium]|nr:hypothetical protein [Deltaproteobacteria bacterium]